MTVSENPEEPHWRGFPKTPTAAQEEKARDRRLWGRGHIGRKRRGLLRRKGEWAG